MNEIKFKVANNLKKYRSIRKMTQKDLAEEINKKLGTDIKHNTISSWEKGVNSIDITILKVICDILEIDLNTIYGVEETENDSSIDLIAANLKNVSKEKLEKIKHFIEFTLKEDD